MKKFILMLITLVLFGVFSFIPVAPVAHPAMAMETAQNCDEPAGCQKPVNCLDHCLTSAAALSNQQTTMPSVAWWLAFIIISLAAIVQFSNRYSLPTTRLLAGPLYLFNTVVLRE
ncbi:MAG: hypothetical protein V1838_00630 [Patescibacteria group bacterium]